MTGDTQSFEDRLAALKDDSHVQCYHTSARYLTICPPAWCCGPEITIDLRKVDAIAHEISMADQDQAAIDQAAIDFPIEHKVGAFLGANPDATIAEINDAFAADAPLKWAAHAAMNRQRRFRAHLQKIKEGRATVHAMFRSHLDQQAARAEAFEAQGYKRYTGVTAEHFLADWAIGAAMGNL
jgi:hypothetical protein